MSYELELYRERNFLYLEQIKCSKTQLVNQGLLATVSQNSNSKLSNHFMQIWLQVCF